MFIQTHADRCTPATREALLARRRDAKARRLAELRVARQAGFTTQIGESTSPALGQEDQALAASTPPVLVDRRLSDEQEGHLLAEQLHLQHDKEQQPGPSAGGDEVESWDTAMLAVDLEKLIGASTSPALGQEDQALAASISPVLVDRRLSDEQEGHLLAEQLHLQHDKEQQPGPSAGGDEVESWDTAMLTVDLEDLVAKAQTESATDALAINEVVKRLVAAVEELNADAAVHVRCAYTAEQQLRMETGRKAALGKRASRGLHWSHLSPASKRVDNSPSPVRATGTSSTNRYIANEAGRDDGTNDGINDGRNDDTSACSDEGSSDDDGSLLTFKPRTLRAIRTEDDLSQRMSQSTLGAEAEGHAGKSDDAGASEGDGSDDFDVGADNVFDDDDDGPHDGNMFDSWMSQADTPGPDAARADDTAGERPIHQGLDRRRAWLSSIVALARARVQAIKEWTDDGINMFGWDEDEARSAITALDAATTALDAATGCRDVDSDCSGEDTDDEAGQNAAEDREVRAQLDLPNESFVSSDNDSDESGSSSWRSGADESDSDEAEESDSDEAESDSDDIQVSQAESDSHVESDSSDDFQ
jgi:hypothetical protein